MLKFYEYAIFAEKKGKVTFITYQFFFVFLFFGIDSRIEYATDSYAVFWEKGSWEWMLFGNGRLINAAVYYVIEALEISPGYIFKLSWAGVILFLTLSVYCLSCLLRRFLDNDWICVLISFFTIVNLYILELLLFIEKGLTSFAVFLCVLAACCTINYFIEGKKWLLLLILCCLLVAVFIYQIIPGIYVLICLPFILYYSHNGRDFLFKNLQVAFFYGMPMGVSFIITKFVLKSERVPISLWSMENFTNVLRNIYRISTDSWMNIPAFWMIFLLVITVGIGISACTIRSERKMGEIVIGLCYLLLAGLFTAFFPFLSGAATVYTPRTVYPYGCIPGVILIYFVLFTGIGQMEKFFGAMSAFLIIVLGMQYFATQDVFIDRYRCNQVDEYYCEILGAKIEQYRSKTGIEIDTICFYKDAAVTWWEKGYDGSNLMVRAQSTGWSDLAAINIYLGTNYKKGNLKEEYIEYFASKNWDIYDEEQLIFEGSILHLCVY